MKRSVCSSLKRASNSTENKPPAPVKSRFHVSWPGQSANAGCNTLVISGRALSQAATLRAAASCASKRSFMLGSPRMTRKASSALTPIPRRMWAMARRSFRAASRVTRAPIRTSEPPDWYLVSACITMSTPMSKPRSASPADQVLSSATSTPRARAALQIAGRSGTSIDTEPGASVQISFVFGWIRSAMPGPTRGS